MKKSFKKSLAILALVSPLLVGCGEENGENGGNGGGEEETHQHDYVEHEAVAPTCAEDGNVKYYTCTGCEDLFDVDYNVISASEIIDPATGNHTYDSLKLTSSPTKVEYTALENFDPAGLKLVKVCSVCLDEVEVASGIEFDKTQLHGNDSKVTASVEGLGSVDIPVTVSKISVSKPSASEATFTYNGEEQTYEIAANDAYEVTNNTRTAAGSQKVTVALKNKVDYAWADGTSDDLEFDFVIGKKAVVISGYSDSYTAKCHVAPSFGTIVADNGATVSTKVYDANSAEVTDLTALEAGNYTVKFSVAESENYLAEEVSKTLTVSHAFTEEVKGADYVKAAATCKDHAVYFKSCVCGAASTSDDDTFVDEEGALAAHTKYWDRETSTEEHYLKCSVCGETLETFSIKPTVTTTQVLDLSQETVSVDLSTGATIKGFQSIKCGNYDLGTDPTNLNVAALKADAQYGHGPGKELAVIALSNDDCAHQYKVPVDVVTKTIKTKADLCSIHETNTDPVWGYYVLGNDIDMAGGDSGNGTASGNQATGLRGIFDGKGHKITNYVPGWKPFFGMIGYKSTFRNVTIDVNNFAANDGHGILSRFASFATIEDVTINVKAVSIFSGKTEADALKTGLIFGATATANTVKNVTVHAEGLELYTILGNNSINDTMENVNVYCKDYKTFAYNSSATSKEGLNVIKDPVAEELDVPAQAFKVGSAECAYTLPSELAGLSVSKISINSVEYGTDLSKIDLSALAVGEYAMVIEGTLNSVKKIYRVKVVLADVILKTAEDLAPLHKQTADGVHDTKYYAMGCDISGVSTSFTGSLNDASGFAGTFNGCGHTLTFGSIGGKGIFVQTSNNSVIKNVHFVANNMTTGWRTKILAGVMNGTVIENCQFDISVSTVNGNTFANGGPIFGNVGGSPITFKDCSFNVTSATKILSLFGYAGTAYGFGSFVKLQGTITATGDFEYAGLSSTADASTGITKYWKFNASMNGYEEVTVA